MVRVLRWLFIIPNTLLVYKELLGSLEPTEFYPSEFAGTKTARERRGILFEEHRYKMLQKMQYT